ncbi:mitochondrial dicarboxylate/tricarboxylate transporter DTC-like [Lycium barbarum]|uniref:mitochondrial dicarboxylate/tricarboxylate transporter DTC-like n=1 Tax=Lycium barbarum TaxID=112863 RepID=UPI00293ED02A|nr:mitochondrial dicarboxylate/tricarboxylate transporter DTC-like [Lycium barbarum]
MEDSSELNNNMVEENPMMKVADHTFLRKSVWPTMKPFVNGGLALTLQGSSAYFSAFLFYKLNPTAKSSPEFMHRKLLYAYQRMPFILFQGGLNMGTLFGSYELLTRKVEALNGGSPLTLYQEAGCGLASGAIRACIWHPLFGPVGAGIAQAATDKYYYFRHIFNTITQVVRNEGVLALWKGVRLHAPVIASHTGMLVSYDRCRIYLKETYGLREEDARLGAGIFSGLCSAACYIPVSYAAGIIGYIQKSTRVESPRSFLFYALKVLKPGGGSNFYSRLVNHALYNSPSVMIMWVFLEAIRDAEESIGL